MTQVDNRGHLVYKHPACLSLSGRAAGQCQSSPEMIAAASFGLTGSVSLALLIVLWPSPPTDTHRAPARLSIHRTAIKVIEKDQKIGFLLRLIHTQLLNPRR